MLHRLLSLVGLSDDGKPRVRRSPRWRAVRAAHLLRQPECQACGRSDKLEVHHILPVHLSPDLELSEGNLLTLCDPGQGGCHLTFGHYHSWKSHNPTATQDAAAWRRRVRARPGPADSYPRLYAPDDDAG